MEKFMKIVNSGYDFRHDKDFKINRPRGSGDFILLILRSPAQFFLHGKTNICQGDSAIIFQKGTPQIYGALNCEYINDWVHFEADETDVEWMKSIGLKFDSLIDFPSVSVFSNLILTICGEYYSNNKNGYDTAHHYFQILLMKLSDALDQKNNIADSKMYKIFKKVRGNIFANPNKDWSAKKISSDLSISCSYFQHLYKQYFNQSLKKDITLARMRYAKYLLFSTDYTISVISEMCGYQNEVHFMRVFKSYTNLTPTDYRKNSLYSEDKVSKSKNFNPYNLTVDTIKD